MKPSVLVTGASSGIGATTAAHLVTRGFEVFGTSRRPEAAAAAAPDVRWIAMDVTDDASVEKGVAEVIAAGRLDAVVCNAGFGIFGSVEEVPLERARAQLETNFFGALRDGETLRSPIDEGHVSTLMCHLGNIAQHLGRSLEIDPATGRIENDAEAMEMWQRGYARGWEPAL